MALSYISGQSGGGAGSGTALTVPAGCLSAIYMHSFHAIAGSSNITAASINGVAMSHANDYVNGCAHDLGVDCWYLNSPSTGTLSLTGGDGDAIWCVMYFSSMVQYVTGSQSVVGGTDPHYTTVTATPPLTLYAYGISVGDSGGAVPSVYGTAGVAAVIVQGDDPTSGADQSRALGYAIPTAASGQTMGWSGCPDDCQVLVWSEFSFLLPSGGPMWWT